jgi:hypothetical protein
MSRLPPDDTEITWRRRWRALGRAADRLLPLAYKYPAPLAADLKILVPASVNVPADCKVKLSEEDRILVADAVDFVQTFVAELPVQIALTDFKAVEADSVSDLAVRAVGNGQHEYAGSFDLLLRVRSTRGTIWKSYNGKEIAFDMKLSGASSNVGINSYSIRQKLAHGQAVLSASQRNGGRLGQCGLVAYLFRRPPGRTMMNQAHNGSWGFLVFDMKVFMNWNPTSKKSPRRVLESGTFLTDGLQNELELTTAGVPLGPPLVLNPRPRRDRWADLEKAEVRRGWVVVHDYVRIFELGPGNAKHAASRVVKRLRDDGCEIQDHTTGGRGPPKKLLKIADLKRTCA